MRLPSVAPTQALRAGLAARVSVATSPDVPRPWGGEQAAAACSAMLEQIQRLGEDRNALELATMDLEALVAGIVESFLEERSGARQRVQFAVAFAAAAPDLEAVSVLLGRAMEDHPAALRFATEFRSEVLDAARSAKGEARLRREAGDAVGAAESHETALQLGHLGQNLATVLSPWFGKSMVRLERVAWDTHCAEVMDYLAQNEKVHPADHLARFRRRFGPGRRCLALFHPSLRHAPVTFVYAALTSELPHSLPYIQAHTGEGHPESELAPRCAVFYSIGLANLGLRGMGIGRRLIVAAVAHLAAEFPSLVTFATLSPLPTFMSWLRSGDASNELEESEARAVLSIPHVDGEGVGAAVDGIDGKAPAELLAAGRSRMLNILDTDGWHRDAEACKVLRPILERLVAVHVLRAEKQCPVAAFHMGNGASLWRVNWMGNMHPRGLRQSAGMMVNYMYDANEVQLDAARRRFIATGVRPASPEVLAMLNVSEKS